MWHEFGYAISQLVSRYYQEGLLASVLGHRGDLPPRSELLPFLVFSEYISMEKMNWMSDERAGNSNPSLYFQLFQRINFNISLWMLLFVVVFLTRTSAIKSVFANNLASIVLFSEWHKVAEDIGIPFCHKRLRMSAAEPYLFLARQWNPIYQRPALNQGRAAWLVGDCTQAQVYWEQALKMSPGDQIAAYWLFWVYGADNSNVPAPLTYQIIGQLGYFGGQRAEAAMETSAARDWYELSITLNPTKATGSRLTSLYRQIGQKEEAITAWRFIAEALPPNNADHWWALGQAGELTQDWEISAYAYGQGAKIADDPYIYWIRQGFSSERSQQLLVQAEQAYHQALIAKPWLPDAYLGLGHVRRRQQQYLDALIWYKQAEAIAPDDATPVYYQGFVYYLHGDYEQARSIIERALLMDPDHIWANYYLAQTLYQVEEKYNAVTYLARAIDLRPNQPEPPWQWVLLLGDWRLELGDRQGAVEAYQKVLIWKPDDMSIEQKIEQAK